jgi:hypothetical protein
MSRMWSPLRENPTHASGELFPPVPCMLCGRESTDHLALQLSFDVWRRDGLCPLSHVLRRTLTDPSVTDPTAEMLQGSCLVKRHSPEAVKLLPKRHPHSTGLLAKASATSALARLVCDHSCLPLIRRQAPLIRPLMAHMSHGEYRKTAPADRTYVADIVGSPSFLR